MEAVKKDFERAMVFIGVASREKPEWMESPAVVAALAVVAGWDESRARDAVEQAIAKGYVETD